jgi:hypothetical protein
VVLRNVADDSEKETPVSVKSTAERAACSFLSTVAAPAGENHSPLSRRIFYGRAVSGDDTDGNQESYQDRVMMKAGFEIGRSGSITKRREKWPEGNKISRHGGERLITERKEQAR